MINNTLEYKDRDLASILCVVLVLFVESLQILIIGALISNYFPPSIEGSIAQSFAKAIPALKPDRQILLYRLFVLTNIVLAVGFWTVFRRNIKDPQWMRGLFMYTGVQAAVTALSVFACFKIIVHQSPPWAWHMLLVSLGAGGVCRLFWPELRRVLEHVYARWLDRDVAVGLSRSADAGVALLIAGCIYAPQLAMFKFVMGVGILYFIACYFFLRVWLNNTLLACAGVLLAIKLHLFNAGIAPVVWLYPPKTFLRYLWDVTVWWAIAKHVQSADRRFLWLAGACAGTALMYVLDTGLVLLAAFYLYLIFYRTLAPGPHVRMKMFFVAPVAVAGLLWFVHGKPAITFFAWPAALPFYDCLKGSQFFAFVMAFIIPLVYVSTILSVATLCYLKQVHWRNILAVVVSAYGLGLYQYFVWHSALDNYYSVGIPFVFVLCFWFQRLLSLGQLRIRRLVSAFAVALALLALLTNSLFLYYHSVVVQS